ncbi:MAG: hypothetical protein H6828_10830 [Planctomycetes bacterium]|nr:hypothetical protein [Planctomycetota bacterium]
MNAPHDMDARTRRFGEALARLESELDWRRLGELHCYEGGEHFFPPEQVDALREAGLVLAAALAGRLRPGGRSVYVGASVGELAVLLCEALVLDRDVRALNLPGEECAEVNRALEAVEQACGFALPRIEFTPLDELEGRYDHGWLVSVLNDPEAFPALHDLLYQRSGADATGRGDLAQERARAERLVDAFLDRLDEGAVVSLTDEELPVIEPRVAVRGRRLELDDEAYLSAVVGDPIRFGTLSTRP